MQAKSAVMIFVGGLGLAVTACDDGMDLDAEGLQGRWIAGVYEYTDNANPQNVVDIIQRDGASFELAVDASGTASTLLVDGQGGTSSDSGTLDSTGTTLTLGGIPFEAQRDGDVLTLRYTLKRRSISGQDRPPRR